jgi:hypothetical protein
MGRSVKLECVEDVDRHQATTNILRHHNRGVGVVFNSLPTGAAVSNFHGFSINSDIDVSGKRRTINVVVNEREMLDS